MKTPYKFIVLIFFLSAVLFELHFRWKILGNCQSCPTKTRQNFSDVLRPSELKKETDIAIMSGWDRAALVRSRCKEVFNETAELMNTWFRFENRVFLANKEKLAYCAIAKAFSSNMKRIFLYLSDAKNSAEDLAMDIEPLMKIEYPHQQNFWKDKSILKHYNEGEQREIIMNSYVKFIFVRNPVLKIISAYRDKFYGQSDDVFHAFFRSTIAKSICHDIEEYKKRTEAPAGLKDGTIDCSRDPVFIDLKSFLSWIILVPLENKTDHSRSYNPHWASSIPLCRICSQSIKYDFVGHFEKGMDDINDIMNFAKWYFPFPDVSNTTFDTNLSVEENMEFAKQVEQLPLEFMSELNAATAVERYVLGYTNLKPR